MTLQWSVTSSTSMRHSHWQCQGENAARTKSEVISVLMSERHGSFYRSQVKLQADSVKRSSSCAKAERTETWTS